MISFNPIKSFVRKYQMFVFLGTLFILNSIQAANTELLDDEAYYWVYSRFLSWGYFDHPPMIAYMIRVGDFFLKHEIGVRLLSVIFSTLSIYVLGLLVNQKDKRLFYCIITSIALLQAGGILAVPDIPLLFFTSLFFLAYRNFIQRMTILNSMLLGLVMSLMLYSKYHGVLVILFTIFSNPGLLVKYKAWLSVVIATIFYLPHIFWQSSHGFPSIQYHLFEHDTHPLEIMDTLGYLVGQILLVGPLSGFVILWGAIKYIPNGSFEKALKYNLLGFYFFFLILTLKGRVEPNWTIPIMVPIVVLGSQYLIHNDRLRRWVYRSLPLTLIIIIAFRIYAMLDIYPNGLLGREEFHGNKRWVEAIRKHANNLPVVFLDSYQRASKYWFYSGKPSFSLNTPYYRRNNFNFWNVEDSLRGKPAYVICPADLCINQPGELITIPEWGSQVCGKTLDPYFSFSGMMIVKEMDTIGLSHYSRLPVRDQHLNDALVLYIYKGDSLVKIYSTGIPLYDLLQARLPLARFLPSDFQSDVYTLYFAIPSCIKDRPSLNSERMVVHIPYKH